MKGLRREKTKSNNAFISAFDETGRPPSRSSNSESTLDFAMTVAKGRLIKGEIRKRFEEQFTAERAHVEEQYAKEILATTMITPVASRRNAVSLNLGSSLVDG